MIINYDRNPALTQEQKMESLIRNIQLSFDEMREEMAELKKEVEALKEQQNGG